MPGVCLQADGSQLLARAKLRVHVSRLIGLVGHDMFSALVIWIGSVQGLCAVLLLSFFNPPFHF